MKTTKTILLLLTFTFAYLMTNAQTVGHVIFNFKTVSAGGNYAPKHVLAVWVEDANGNFVKTNIVRANARKKYLYTWKAKSNENTTDAITGSTISTHQTHSVFWNCRDISGNLVADGDYKIFVEFTSEHAQGPVTSVTFTKGPSPQILNPTDEANFININLSYGLGASIFEKPITKKAEQIHIGPNPFFDKTLISFEFNEVTNYSLKIIDNNGRIIREINDTDKLINYYWDGSNQQGTKLATGTYIVIIESKSVKAVRKIVKY
ncbi:MAG: DUF2271 domain-containing protein [Saprospiraceae bacterium]|nr:DUF2271 domain-containing protein [Saprospiraceae bacterium]